LARTRVWRKGVLEKEDFPTEAVSDYLEQDDTIVWADLCVPDRDDIQQLADELGLDPLAVEDALETHERPKVERFRSHLFVTTYAMSLTDDSDLRLSKISAFVLPQALVTVRHEDFDVDPIVSTWDDTPELLSYGPRGLLYALLDSVVDGHLACLQTLDDRVEEAEDRLFDEHPSSGNEIQRRTYMLRRQMTGVRKVVLPMRDVADTLLRHAELHKAEDAHGQDERAQTEMVERLRDLRDHVVRANEWNDSLRDVVATMFETGLSLADANLNQIVRKLSAWAAIIAVPTAVSGFYGENVPYPGYGERWGFLVSLAATILLAVGIYTAFKKKGWL
jgi:magnesium transporter